CSPLRIGTFGRQVPEFDRYPLPLLWKVSSLIPCSLLGHVTGPRRLQDHS
ncbi:unnamed protein product, partial [Staurois parvus]